MEIYEPTDDQIRNATKEYLDNIRLAQLKHKRNLCIKAVTDINLKMQTDLLNQLADLLKV